MPFYLTLFSAFALLICQRSAGAPPAGGNAVIRGPAGPSYIVIKTTDRLAGAIDSLTWNGKEFIDSFDHGRQLQSACSFDCALAQPFWAECYNPTESGSRDDGAGGHSSSRLISLRTASGELETTTQMAFWLAPGEASEGRPALNGSVLSEYRVSKHVLIGYKNLPHVIEYTVKFAVPNGERHTFSQFESLTGYMPAEFTRMWTFDRATGTLVEIDAGPGEQNRPLVFANHGGDFAMGIYSPDQPSRGFETLGYGRFRFENERVLKWNCVFRVRNADRISAGEYRFRMFLVVGTLENVRHAFVELVNDFSKP